MKKKKTSGRFCLPDHKSDFTDEVYFQSTGL